MENSQQAQRLFSLACSWKDAFNALRTFQHTVFDNNGQVRPVDPASLDRLDLLWSQERELREALDNFLTHEFEAPRAKTGASNLTA